MRARPVVVPIAVAVLLGAACAHTGRTEPHPGLDVELVAALSPFDACDDYLAYVKEQALERVGPYGLDGGAIADDGIMPMAEAAVDGVRPAPATPQTTNAAGKDGTDASSKSTGESDPGTGTGTGTNNQEEGIDEADIVKIDGNRIVTLRGNQLIVVTMTDGTPSVTTRLDLGSGFSGDRLFLLPGRAYVLGTDTLPASDSTNTTNSTNSATVRNGIEPGRFAPGSAAIVEVSLANGAAVTHRTTIDGSILDGRMANGTVRLVLSTPGGTGLGFVYPSAGDQRANDRAEATNRDVINESKIDDWVPSTSTDGGARAPLLGCDHLYRPAEMSGFSMLSILTISDGLGSLTGSGVLADGQITYASTGHLYVATNGWASDHVRPGEISKPGFVAQHTDVHSFSIAGAAPATYEASGRVEGHVLNQYSMSESGGDLRIATTVEAGAQGDSRLVVLRRDGSTLNEIGRVGGLGATEQIKSVRYVGDVAYVVTFRQTDPFYVVSLADPTAPRVLGELKVPGFSSYLHPVGDHLVLGVGSDATGQGRLTGAKLSLYDTSDPLLPKELDSWTSDALQFGVDYDSHAFHWDAERSTAYLPYHTACFERCDTMVGDNGVLVVKVAGGAIAEIGRINHLDTIEPTPSIAVGEPTQDRSGPQCDPTACDPAPASFGYAPTITRVFVVGDRIITLSDAGVAAHNVTTLERTGFASF